MWSLRGMVVRPLEEEESEQVVVFYATDLVKWMREQDNQICDGIADWLDVCAMDILRQHERNCDKL